MKAFQNSQRSMLNWFLDVRSELIDLEGSHRALAIASHIACGYQVLNVSPCELAPTTITLKPFDRVAYLAEDRDYRLPIAELYDFINGEMREYVSHVILLSSLASMDYNRGWSDIDAFMVIKDTTACDGQKLNQLRNLCLVSGQFFRRVTPLQHHGFIVITESDLRSYPTSCMPPAVFERSLSLLKGVEKMSMIVQPGDLGALHSLKERANAARAALKSGELRHHPYKGRYLRLRYRNADDSMYQLYCMLGYIMTVPAYLMDGLGRGCYKGDSFRLARTYFSNRAWAVIDKASEIRRLWQEREGTAYRLNAIPEWVPSILGDNYFEEWLLLLDEAIMQIEAHIAINHKRESI